ncbi:MAG: hypothetical protein LBS06_00520 [Treponema sp.]|jgi:hypothetical protein|nr:hypothetical protein [Treponema sp.]
MRRPLGIFGVLFFAAGAAVMAQEPGLEELLPGLRDRAVILNIAARVVENDRNEVWNSFNSKVTISGRPVGLKLVGTNVVVAVQFTPYMRPNGKNILVAQGQIWIDIPNEGIRYQTTMQTISLELGEQIYFFPLGSANSPNEAHIEIKLKLEPYTANEGGGQPAGTPPPDPKGSGPLPVQGNESP